MARPDLTVSSSYPDDPQRDCDLVMKGGISSGIIYPRAACTLALTYRFRSIGGASAGAIAAAAVAAAEHGRARDGFVRLAALPDELGSTLSGLFQAGPTTRGPFAVLSGWLEPHQTPRQKVRRSVSQVAAQTPLVITVIMAALLVVPVAVLAVSGHGGALGGLGVAVAAVIWVPAAAALAVAAAGYVFVRRTLAAMADNGFGLCNGHQRDPAQTIAPLTDWMTQTFDELAGLPAGERPLTFGDLWGDDAVALQRPLSERAWRGEPVDTAERLAAAAARQVDLVVMTTCLTFQRPFQFPFSSNEFFFCPDHLSEYFPQSVVEHFLTTAPDHPPIATDLVDGATTAISMACPDHGTAVRYLPAPWDMPIVVAARLSLSFPGLISAVPFFAVDWARKPGKRALIPVWFSDGGISSNFPMHFFDSPFPSRPTFGINLGPVNPDYPDQLVWKPEEGEGAGHAEATPLASMPAFGHAILNTMQDWVDNTQITMPGYRDRIVTVRQMRGEGGMNLKMDRTTIEGLAQRGADAAATLDDFDLRRHRWIRYRVAMSGIDDLLLGLNIKYANDYQAFIATYGPAATSFTVGGAAATAADAAATAELMSVADQWRAAGHPSSAGTVPRPKPDLRFVPHQ